jgi:imidazolonepropionase
MRALFKDIKGLVGAYRNAPDFVAGEEMKNFPVHENSWLLVENGLISDFGHMTEFPGVKDWTDLDIVDCEGRYILPSWCDSHTHLVYANDRAGEFLDRLRGLSYSEIAAKGGGIINSAKALSNLTEDELFERSLTRLYEIIAVGVGAVEIKSGYGLSLEGERKILRVIARLKENSPIPIKATFLGCHAVPKEFKSATEFTEHVVNDMLPEFVAEGLVDYVDAFCEKGYFSVADTSTLIEAASLLGVKSKIHVNQFNILDGVELCINKNVLSVDHLEVLSDKDVEVLKNRMKTSYPAFPVALPICSHFLNIPYTESRRLIDEGLPLVIATDQNPGTAPSGNMLEAVRLGSIKMGLEPIEAIAAATLNGSAAMELQNEVGTISPGKRANFILTVKISGLEVIPYRLNDDVVENVYVNGECWVG